MKNNIFKYIRGYGFNSVVVLKALKIFVSLFAVVIILITLAYSGIVETTKKSFISENSAEVKRVALLFENFFREAEYLSAKVFTNRDIEFFFSLNNPEAFTREQEEKLKNSLDAYSNYNTGIRSLYLYNAKNDCLFTFDGVREKTDPEYFYWLENSDSGFKENYKIVYRKNKNGYLQSVFLIKKQGGDMSYIAVELDIQYMKDKIKNLIGSDVQIYVVKDNEIIFSNTSYEKPEWFSKISENKEGYLKEYSCVYGSQDGCYYDFTYILAAPSEGYMSGIRQMYISFMLVFFILFIIIVAVSLSMSADSLDYITNFINIFETRKTSRKLKENEIKYISDRIIYLLNDNEKLKKEVEERIDNYNEMQYKALQKQITPHFINNSLTVLGMNIIKEYGYDGSCSKMLTKLSRIVRYSYISENIFVTLGEELSFLEDYMTFLKFRYENFDFSIECDEELKKCKILKMILQPFTENAIFYGIKDNGGHVLVKVEKADENIEITVFDNGIGMSGKTIAEIYEAKNDESFADKKIGIKNVYKRLKLVYGNNAEIEVKSELGGFTEFKITIPQNYN